MELFREFTFEAAHRLPELPPEHKCSRIHGHSFRVTVIVFGDVDSRLGWVLDYADIEAAWESVAESLDYRYLNEVPGLENPTDENIARWIWNRMRNALPLRAITVMEARDVSGCTYRGLS